ncbi:segregation and condensation protein A [Streptomyces sp. ME19-01-6]|uniref:segregation and condensation protein A n=1 Tax=Streptomyces sp. ME19-01-6 TaxID=3028686 RepID=UPI0029B45716|nr:segregation/condensation protein A [Streptomyces sp. ME19-01-6]MDX3231580.1 segregation/condensation protein A [Streptomyces sp. ME19-01-6]
MPTNPTPAQPPRPPRRILGRGPGTGPRATGTAHGDQAPPPEAPPAEPGPVPTADGAAPPAEAADARQAGPPDADNGAETTPEQPPVTGAAIGRDTGEGGPEAASSRAVDSGQEAPDGQGTGPGQGKFTVRLANFEGPFDLLLQLISKHKLDVTEVALSKVTDEFMAHIRAMGPDWDLDQTTEFLVVAATLLDLKAARLLPAAEVEDEADLALLEARDLLFARLLQYRAFKRIADILNDRLIAESRRYPRTVGLEPHHADLLPEVVISIGAEGFAKLAVKAMQPKPKPQVYVDHIHAPLVSVREQAEVVVARLRELGEASFQTLTEDAPDVLTVVARFLALLELYRERAVHLDQEEALGSLMVRWTGAEGRQPLVTDEFDQEEQQDRKQEQRTQRTQEERAQEPQWQPEKEAET